MTERRRPPRLLAGDGKLLPLVRGGSTKQVGGLLCRSRAARGGGHKAWEGTDGT